MSNTKQPATPVISEESQKMLDSLREAVQEALKRKHKLGQYAVIWKDGKPVIIGEDAPTNQQDELGS
ncbi:MAG: hypothetical protein OI74_13420 [Gammaproteobacteria bacterium (ex Lamellibrachia satsuma)]|nr:MAG: hypothetical protein HPY30_16295 [Gammaproteobacteria bacterium (ex Lamellibrachia satsuma)]RRS31640.1 MAG: hypothetical protein OI74_13420 [Gammaproteobacteria bacterium (ex Lamellibrachia satsuma)]RRS36131.1 MAG: hypothetical protein NV67_08440 [Gammaproteobacteria bacterium (ex Lamellibrachia satsuma)]